jgi:hypothetical protein
MNNENKKVSLQLKITMRKVSDCINSLNKRRVENIGLIYIEDVFYAECGDDKHD